MTDDSAEPDLWSPPYGRVRQAQMHFDALTDDVKRYRQRNEGTSVRISQHNAHEATNPLVKVTWSCNIAEPIPARWALLLGDILHNLRSALDHAIFTLSVQEQGRDLSEHEARKIGFPICRNPSDFAGRADTLWAVGDPVRAAVAQLQPTEDERISLWPLHELDRINKHRSLHVVQNLPYDFDLKVTPEPAGLEVTYIQLGPLEFGTKVASCQWTRSIQSSDVDVRPQITYGESIQETERTPALPLSAFLVNAVIDVAECVAVLASHFK